MLIRAIPQTNRFVKVNALVVGVFEDEKPKTGSATAFASRDKSDIEGALKDKRFKGGFGEYLVLNGAAGAPYEQILILGLGKKRKYTHEHVRKAASAIYEGAKKQRWSSIRVDYASLAHPEADGYACQSLAEGFLLSEYSFDRYKSSKENGKSPLQTVEVSFKKTRERQALDGSLARAQVVAQGVSWARDLGNEPPNVLYPDSYARRIKKMAAESGLRCTVFDEKRMAVMKMGGIMAVGQGSHRKPKLVVLEYRPQRPKNRKPVVFVGKGITFDTGGISLKPGKSMDEMKFDMCGSAAVAATMRTVAKLKMPLHVVGITPLAENMPGGGAQRPGDTITCFNGKTVDVMNTDAEGRLVLADALAYAKKYNAECVVDIATLTGACAQTLDYVASGVMGTDPKLVQRLKEAGEATGERLWEFPLWEDYEEFIKGSYGDVQNISRKTAGIITAGLFLKHFADHSPWAHLDIAGTAWATTARAYTPVGATGVGVRLFIRFLESYL